MKKKIYCYSESLILTLCKEIEYIKNRSKNINQSLNYCQNELLSNRLKIELNKLNIKRSNILRLSENLFTNNYNNLSIEFLFEISKRSNSFQKI